VSLEVLPVEGLPEVRPGDDLPAMLVEPLRGLGIRDGDVVAITQKIVSKAEGRLVPGRDRAEWVERETRRVVARRGDLVIAETAHGFICANAGVDASNVEPGMLALLPEDPDASADRIRTALCERLSITQLGVVITDTFGRPWRQGLVNVGIGCAGMPALVDLRGEVDHTGRELEATIVALADEVAASGGLVMGKADRIPAALVRGVELNAAPPGRAADLVRSPEEDLFRASPLQSISSMRSARSFRPGDVPRETIEEAVRAACTAPRPLDAPGGALPWRFTVLETPASRHALLVAVAEAEASRGRVNDETGHAGERADQSDRPLDEAATLVVPWVSFSGMARRGDPARTHAEQELVLLSTGAAIQTLLLAIHAQGFASCWSTTAMFHQEETRAALEMDAGWFALGIVGVGRITEGGADERPRPPIELDDVLGRR
jgi:coenzyme F420-0:L-glutamate ligase/coenzyme F420-1:gamma-L-glutamate ligase